MAGLRRYANKRDESEPQIVAALEQLGCLVIRMDKPVDLLIQVPGVRQIILGECKTGKAGLTDDQKALIARGWEVWILREVQDAVNMVNTVRRQAA